MLRGLILFEGFFSLFDFLGQLRNLLVLFGNLGFQLVCFSSQLLELIRVFFSSVQLNLHGVYVIHNLIAIISAEHHLFQDYLLHIIRSLIIQHPMCNEGT